MEKYSLKIDGNDYDVEISVEQNIANVLMNGKWYKVDIDKKSIPTTTSNTTTTKKIDKVETPKQESAPSAPTTASNSNSMEIIESPLPGNIVDVLVNVGETVKKGDVIIVIEAMKMENNIMAPADGVIRSVLASPGKTVMLGDPLVKLEKL